MRSENVVQVGVCNVAGLPVTEAGMDCAGGEVSAMVAADPAALAGRAQDGTGDQVRRAARAACHGAADVQSAVIVTSNEEERFPCHTRSHELPDLVPVGEGCGGGIGGNFDRRGGGGSRARARAHDTIGLEAAENFRNGQTHARHGRAKKGGAAATAGVVEAVRPYGRKALFARVIATGQIVLVKLGRGLHAERFTFPCWLNAERTDGRWTYGGPVPEPRCSQCFSRTAVDCYEQPCGLEKKKGGAA